MRSRAIWPFSHAEPTPSSARRACRLAAQQARCRWIARWGRTLACWRGSRCWSSRSRTVPGCTPSSLAIMVLGHRRVIARSVRYSPSGEAQLRGSCGQLLVGGGTALAGGAHPAGWRSDACGGQQVVDHRGGGAELAGQLGGTGVPLAACLEIAAKVGEPLVTSMIVKAALPLIDDRKAATDAEPAGR